MDKKETLNNNLNEEMIISDNNINIEDSAIETLNIEDDIEDNLFLENENDDIIEESDEINLISNNENNEEMLNTNNDNHNQDEVSTTSLIKEKIYNYENFSLENVWFNSPNKEIEYMENMKNNIFNQEKVITIYKRMGFFKKRRALKYNKQLIENLDYNFLETKAYIDSIKENYKVKFEEYVKKQKLYKESLFKL